MTVPGGQESGRLVTEVGSSGGGLCLEPHWGPGCPKTGMESAQTGEVSEWTPRYGAALSSRAGGARELAADLPGPGRSPALP